jgi:thioredoxin 1
VTQEKTKNTIPIPNMSTLEITSPSQFDKILTDTTAVIVDFHATWCGPCHAVAPVYAKLAEEHSSPNNVAFVKIDVDEQPEIAGKYGITAMPTFLVIKEGNVVETIRGANPPALKKAVASAAADAKKAGETKGASTTSDAKPAGEGKSMLELLGVKNEA